MVLFIQLIQLDIIVLFSFTLELLF